ncbi:hypothetical protein G9464_06280 [Halostella sp. JP-L12]|uniref:hypothetical protein n=1 Tax=Halostella TaxID=1843185 RepID=UPI000EF82F5A|nr:MULTISPECIES: hypothetical protein [Halostella]NHN47205.1 hypothetical protein [Halostella sp. JP-L12]
MTRFDADTPTERRKLFVDAITAHRERDSAFLTIEADVDTDELAPWIQISQDTLNMDCTDEEMDRLKDLLGEFPSFTIDEVTRPDEAEGTNVRVVGRGDANRVAQFVDRAFVEVYDRTEEYRAWVVDV